MSRNLTNHISIVQGKLGLLRSEIIRSNHLMTQGDYAAVENGLAEAERIVDTMLKCIQGLKSGRGES